MNYQAIEADIIAAAKEQHKKLSEKNPAINMVVRIMACQSGSRKYYKFEFADKSYESDTDRFSELTDFAVAVEEAVKKLSKLRGYMVKCHRSTFYKKVRDYVWNSWSNEPVEVTDGITLYTEPSKEFKSLAKWIEKFSGTKLGMFDLYSVGIGGKRGRIYGEEEERDYLCYNGAKCRRILDWIIKNRSSRDILVVAKAEMDDVPNRDISIRLETECNGTRYSYLHLEVLTPGGKKKSERDTYYI